MYILYSESTIFLTSILFAFHYFRVLKCLVSPLPPSLPPSPPPPPPPQNRSGTTTECAQVQVFSGHRDGVWHVTHARNGMAVIGTASAGKKQQHMISPLLLKKEHLLMDIYRGVLGFTQSLQQIHRVFPYMFAVLHFEWRDNLFLFNAHQSSHEYY